MEERCETTWRGASEKGLLPGEAIKYEYRRLEALLDTQSPMILGE